MEPGFTGSLGSFYEPRKNPPITHRNSLGPAKYQAPTGTTIARNRTCVPKLSSSFGETSEGFAPVGKVHPACETEAEDITNLSSSMHRVVV